MFPTASIIPTKLASYFYLKDDDFDHKYDFEYNGGESKRGGWPYYYPPKGFFKIGIKAEGRYDNGNDDWLDAH